MLAFIIEVPSFGPSWAIHPAVFAGAKEMFILREHYGLVERRLSPAYERGQASQY